MSYGISYESYEENTKFSELNSFYCLQLLIWSEKLQLLDLVMEYKKLGEYCFNHSENWAMLLEVMPF